ncbi:MAG: hypothetical protein GY751_22815 [Bacteroidetes bacterium]|nr:hypothetical protein [Bacteroidota bacterium]
MSVYLKQLDQPVVIGKQVFKNGDGVTGTLYLASSDLDLDNESLAAICKTMGSRGVFPLH